MAVAHVVRTPGRALAGRRGFRTWAVSIVATAASTYALDAAATAAGVLLVASGLLDDVAHRWVVVFLVVSYAAWGVGLAAALRANSVLLATTGTSTNVLSKAAYDLTRRLTGRHPRAARGGGRRIRRHGGRQGDAVLRGRLRCGGASATRSPRTRR